MFVYPQRSEDRFFVLFREWDHRYSFEEYRPDEMELDAYDTRRQAVSSGNAPLKVQRRRSDAIKEGPWTA